MLSPGDETLVRRDPLTGLALLLDDDALAERLGAPVSRGYLRHKRGVSCTLALDVGGRPAFALAYRPGAPKLAKTVAAARPDDLLLVDDAAGVVVARPPADRDLPALARLARDPARLLARVGVRGIGVRGVGVRGVGDPADPAEPAADPAASGLRTLAHKPQRRWVGLLTPASGEAVVLRVHRPADTLATLGGTRALQGAGLRVPQILGADATRGVVALTWVPGTGLHRLLAAGTATADDLRATGAALAALHALPAGALPVRSAPDEVTDLRRAAEAVSSLDPTLAGRAHALAERLAVALSDRRTSPVTVHGDFSADQVVIDADGTVGLVDLDAVGGGEAEGDLGSAIAALHSGAVRGADRLGPWAAADVTGPASALLAGHEAAGCAATVDEDRLRVHTAAALLRRAVDPFRRCSPRWPDEVARLLTTAEDAELAGWAGRSRMPVGGAR
ncbi:phosphotransferase [Cellulomonas sp. ATA003]|uniref:phosphotransferase n=1 Tax=Cellulomonas sp. ATA003 TaxID=3073064 RepID=UPI002873BCAA|nr:phosphotransferase [Cellulomonas sp. ATA003]WNB87129.1 hypothetical protein REH70_08430 [Cellulomonas sp. ATA003]